MAMSPDDERLRVERMQMLARQAKTGTRVAMANTVVLGLLLVPVTGWLYYALWAAAMLASFLARDRVIHRVISDGRLTPREERIVTLATVFLGFVINLPAALFIPKMGVEIRGIYTMVLTSWAAVAVMVLGIHPRSYLSYVAIGFSLVGVGWWRAVDHQTAAFVIFTLGMAMLVLAQFSRRFAHVFHQTVEMRHEKEELVAKLQASIEETALANKARSRFLAAASHDLLQPVHAMQLLVSVLRRSESEGKREQAAQRIELTARSIDGMFRGLLDQARLDAGAIQPRIASVSLDTVCRAIEAAYGPRCQEKGLSFSLDCPRHLFVLADPALVDRVLRNVVDNAVKFTAQGSVKVSAYRHGDEVHVRVADTGIGIEPDDRPKVFDAFYRGASAARSGADGVGLGLAVTHQMVQMMNGSIHVGPGEGGGTLAEVVLPADVSAVIVEETAAATEVPFYQRILVVEDDRAAREALHLWLVDHGSQVLAVASLGEAMVVTMQRGFAPDVIVADLKLSSGVNGLQTIGELRKRYGPLPAVLVTGEPIEQADVPSDIALLRKPLDPRQLESLLQRPTA
jgi:signal transduction histidine kinase